MLSEQEKHQVAARVAAFEAATGVQLVTTLLPRCDHYPVLPWKAFALGIAAGTGLVLLAVGVTPFASLRALLGLTGGWGGDSGGVALAIVLGAGLMSAALALLVPGYARWFLSGARAEGEVRQAAQALFLEHELFQTRARTGVLMLVSIFERRVVLLADRGLRARLPEPALGEVVAAMTAPLRRRAVVPALLAGIEHLESQVRTLGLAAGAADKALPDYLDPASGEPR